MLFSSFIFIFVFLPSVLFIYFALCKWAGPGACRLWLLVASLVFYGWWKVEYVLLIVAAILFNYCMGTAILRAKQNKKIYLALGIFINIACLFYFKYTNYLVDSLSLLSGSNIRVETIALPLAISFFTFQAVAYLVDTYRGSAARSNLLSFSLFMTFFPQLIAGPIVHHATMIPQYESSRISRMHAGHFAVGLTIFCIGLFKKCVLADSFAGYANPVFGAAAAGDTVTMAVAWSGAIAYTLQLYYDFSGYSDMAIGLARLFGVRIPVNFNSPYKAGSIIEFWTRWHITLSQFLKNYLYIPLGGNRKGEPRKLVNIFITMLLGGIWHGAGTQFIIWGGLHGVFITANHVWRKVAHVTAGAPQRMYTRLVSWMLTMLCVIFAWVFFRAESVASAWSLVKSMVGGNGVALPGAYFEKLNSFAGLGTVLQNVGVDFSSPALAHYTGGATLLAVVFFLTLLLPNTQEVMGRFYSARAGVSKTPPRLRQLLRWRPTPLCAAITSASFVASLCILYWREFFLSLSTPFLYFQF